jgi:hypothetical protein
LRVTQGTNDNFLRIKITEKTFQTGMKMFQLILFRKNIHIKARDLSSEGYFRNNVQQHGKLIG